MFGVNEEVTVIDITMTATKRPAILDVTLSSFKRHLFKDTKCSMILNIDPAGLSIPASCVSGVAKKYFDIRALKVSSMASFPKAFHWVWSQAVSADFVFNLEDDWELLRSVDLDDMIKVMKRNHDLAILRLPWRPLGKTTSKNWKYFFPWNSQFFECPARLKRSIGFCGHPSLIRGEFVRATVPHLNTEQNSEKQFHYNPKIVTEVDKWRFGVYGYPEQSAAIKDIGRKWMIDAGLKKAGSKAFFTNWETAK